MDLFNKKRIQKLEREKTDLTIDLMNAGTAINNYKQTLETVKKTAIEEEKIFNKIISEKDKTISGLNLSLSSAESYIEELKTDNNRLSLKLEELENKRRKSASACGGYVTKINKQAKALDNLSSNLSKANQKIAWLSKRRGSPTFAEINAYDYQQKEVERRQAIKDKELRDRKEEQLTIDFGPLVNKWNLK